MKVSVVVPVFNEEKTIETIDQKIRATGIASEIIYVNDGSTDASAAILAQLTLQENTRLVSHAVNKGKGCALRSGVESAVGEVVILQDADLEYDPRAYANLLAPFADQSVQIVFGARFMKHTPHVFYLPHYLANKMLTFLTNLLFGSHLNDMETGYKVFRKRIFDDLSITAMGFEFEPEFTAKALLRGFRIHEVPISFNPRNYQQGKKIKFKDALKAVWTLIRIRLLNS
jgi:glycosyltransferase involved in cell wall biosynthesis